MDGEWAVTDHDLTFLSYKPTAFLLTNNLVMRSSRCEFFLDLRLTLDAKAVKGTSDRKEVLVLGVSPSVYDINGFQPDAPLVTLIGVNFFFFRDGEDKGVVVAKEYPVHTQVDLRTMFSEDFRENPRAFCEFQMTGKDAKVNATIDFEMGSVYLTLDDKECVIMRAGRDVFPEDKATMYLTGAAREEALASLAVREARVSKYVELLGPTDRFTDGTHHMVSSLVKHDPNYYANASLSNLMLMNVDSPGPDWTGTAADVWAAGDGHRTHPGAGPADVAVPGARPARVLR